MTVGQYSPGRFFLGNSRPVHATFIFRGAPIGVGTDVGGWGVIKTLGHHLTKLGPPEGFAAETNAAIVRTFAAHLGVPTSTTHTIPAASWGMGATRGMSSVRWGLGEKIVLAWVFTLPSTIMMGGRPVLGARQIAVAFVMLAASKLPNAAPPVEK